MKEEGVRDELDRTGWREDVQAIHGREDEKSDDIGGIDPPKPPPKESSEMKLLVPQKGKVDAEAAKDKEERHAGPTQRDRIEPKKDLVLRGAKVPERIAPWADISENAAEGVVSDYRKNGQSSQDIRAITPGLIEFHWK
jgi:hypothetical protein